MKTVLFIIIMASCTALIVILLRMLYDYLTGDDIEDDFDY